MPLPAPILAVIAFSFDPLLHLGPLDIRWQTIGVTVAILAALGLAARVVSNLDTQQLFSRRRTTRAPETGPDLAPSFPDAPVIGADGGVAAPRRELRIDDLVLIVLGVVPGAVIGGRLAHVVTYWDAYAAQPISVFNPAVGGLSLFGAVLGGLVTGAYVAKLIGAPVRRWADVAAVPFLLALGLGKLAQLLGGSGQGLGFDGAWAVAFLGDGPWVSASPEVPAHPAQVYEGIWLLAGIALIVVLARDRRRPELGALFVAALSWFLIGRFLIGFTWRDPSLVGPLNGEQALALAALIGIGTGLWLRQRRSVASAAVAMALVLTVSSATSSAFPARAGESTVDTMIASMSTDEKVGQLFMVSFYGDQAADTDAAPVNKNRNRHGVDNAAQLIAQYHVGGVIYFQWAGNVVSTKQTARLSNGVQLAALGSGAGVPLLVSTDQEGGSVTRLAAPAVSFPGSMALGATRNTSLARSAARAIGEELRAVGINENLAPVGDVNVNPANPVIGLRSFGSDASLVAGMTAAQVAGYEVDAGIAATAKHFPGHGDTDVDSHTGLPVINHTLSQWQDIDAPPFEAAIAAGIDVIMSAHISVPALDPSGTPATLSAPILTGLLREELGFDGVVMTDSLGMAALKQNYTATQIPVLAIKAGADILLNPPKISVAFAAVRDAVSSGDISVARLNASVRRILELKERLGLLDSAMVNVNAAANVVGSAAHRAVQTSVARASVTMLENEANLLPLGPMSGESALVVGPSRASLDVLAAALRNRGLATEVMTTGERPGNATIANAASRAGPHDYVLLLTHNADRTPAQRSLANALAATDTPLVSASIGRPYDAAHYDADAHFALYSGSVPSLRALVAVLFGEYAPTGKLPVAIPAAGDPSTTLYPFGFGLTYP